MTPLRPGPAATVLRTVAVAIAITAVVDPAVKTSIAGRPRLALVTGTASPAADRVRARLLDTLGESHEIASQITSDAAAAIVVGDRYPDEPVPASLLVATVTAPAAPQPRVRIASVSAPRDVPAGTAIRVGAAVEAVGAGGTSTDFTVTIGGLEVGRTSHRWSVERERWHPVIDVVPVGAPPWVVRASVSQPDDRETAAPAVALATVARRDSPLAVQIYEPRPSWATTFVRRALESDARFRVETVSLSSRGVAARTPGGLALADPRLDSFELIVVGGLERLSAADVRSLDRFMRERGGAVALVPDARVDGGAVRDLIPLQMTERLLERPEKLATRVGAAPLDASELLLLRAPAAGFDGEIVATAADGSPVVVSLPHGRGRLLVSGAMDAWRNRASDNRGFDRFWQAATGALALAAAPSIDLVVSPTVLAPLERAEVFVRLRSADGSALTALVDGEPIRLWPEPETGAYRGTFTAGSTPGRTSIEVRAGGQPPYHVAARDVEVQDTPAEHPRGHAPLSLLASSHRGIDVTPERLDDLERFVRVTVTSPAAGVVRRPMRTTWWMLPFAAALSAEWWLRRRRGHR